MQERIACALLGIGPVFLGLHHLICPALWGARTMTTMDRATTWACRSSGRTGKSG